VPRTDINSVRNAPPSGSIADETVDASQEVWTKETSGADGGYIETFDDSLYVFLRRSRAAPRPRRVAPSITNVEGSGTAVDVSVR
jgi:hypothetical protein